VGSDACKLDLYVFRQIQIQDSLYSQRHKELEPSRRRLSRRQARWWVPKRHHNAKVNFGTLGANGRRAARIDKSGPFSFAEKGSIAAIE
jgi:hypothetical protein